MAAGNRRTTAQRQRPRLKPFSITCSLPDCSKPAVRLYPTRPGARSRIHHTYCRPEHGKRHWAQLRREQLAADAQPYQCAGPGCTVMIEPAFAPGRRKVYHDDACRERAKTERRRRLPAGDVREARAKALAAMQRAAVALRDAAALAAALAAAFTQWMASEYADVNRRIQKVKARAAEKGREPNWDRLQGLIEDAAAVVAERKEWADGQEELDRVAGGRAAAAHRAAASLRTIEARLARRAATARRRRAQEQQPATAPAVVAQEQRDTVTGLTPSEIDDLRARSRAGDM